MSIFSRLAKLGDVGEKYLLKPLTETFVSPVARELIRPVVSARSAIQELVPGGKTGQESVATPFGEVKPFANILSKKSRQSPTTIKPGEALMGAVELAASVPGAATKALKPIAGPIKKAVAPIARGLRAGAIEDIGRALAPTTKGNKAITTRIAPEILDRGIFGTAKGIQKKALKGLRAAGTAIDDFGKLEGSTDVSKVLGVLDEAKGEFVVDGVAVNKRAVGFIDEVKQILNSVADETGKIGREQLRAVRRIWDDEVRQAGGFAGKSLSEGSEVSVKETASNAIRNLLADEIPDLAKLNKEYNFWASLNKVAKESSGRRVGQSGLARKAAGAMTGGIIGSSGGAIGAAVGAEAGQRLAQISGSSLYRSLSANGKKRLADLLVDGVDLEKVASYIARPGIKATDFNNFLKDEAAKVESQNKKPLEDIFGVEPGASQPRKSLEDIFSQ